MTLIKYSIVKKHPRHNDFAEGVVFHERNYGTSTKTKVSQKLHTGSQQKNKTKQ